MKLTRVTSSLLLFTFVYLCSAQNSTGATGATGAAGATGVHKIIRSNLKGHSYSLYRRRMLYASNVPNIPCNPGTSGDDCVCPGKCLTYYNSTGGCHPNNCWKWDDMNDKCQEAGKPFVPAIILQSIPFTGGFGAGWGNVGRWDIFNIYMAVVFGPFAILIIACCCAMGGACAQNEDGLDCCKCLGTCFGCLWSIAICVLWIWGIVMIANKPLAPWTDWQGNSIMCALAD